MSSLVASVEAAVGVEDEDPGAFLAVYECIYGGKPPSATEPPADASDEAVKAFDALFAPAEPARMETAKERVESLDSDAAVKAVRTFVKIDATANALTLLFALTEVLLTSLEELAAAGKGWADSEALPAVEALPPAGTVAALWKEVLGEEDAAQVISDAEETDGASTRALLERLQAATTAVRQLLPGVLVGPEGAPTGSLEAAFKLLPAASGAGSSGSRKKARVA